MVELKHRKLVQFSSGNSDVADKDEDDQTIERSLEAPLGEFGLKKWKMQDFVPYNIMPLHYWNMVLLAIGHGMGFYGLYLSFTGQTPNFLKGLLVSIGYGYIGGIGVTAGAHRLYTHKAYKANKPLQVLLMLMQTSTLQYPLIKWCRDHRIHHKYTDTNADPHSAARGFWFSHIGWVISPEHPDVLRKEKTIPMNDLEDNPILDFQARHYWKLLVLTLIVIPCALLYYLFPQPILHIVCINYTRWIIQTHVSACVNSVAHIFGDKPYDKTQSAVDNRLLSLFTVGEAWHNFHHTFPYDYKTSELPFYTFNISTAFIDFFAWLGWATELKTVPKELIEDRARRTGDGTHPSAQQEDEPKPIWGWGDKDMLDAEADRVKELLQLSKRISL